MGLGSIEETPMKIGIALSILAAAVAGCGTVPPAQFVATADMPNCFDTHYDAERSLFTMKEAALKSGAGSPNEQCLLTVLPRGAPASASQLSAGTYTVYLANGGGGGAGGTLQAFGRGGGGGGGGAGAFESQTRVELTEGVYKLTMGAGGPGGMSCTLGRSGSSGGVGWAGSPSSMVRISTGEVVAGPVGADSYARPTRAQNDRMGGKVRDGHGGSGPGQTSGGQGASTGTSGVDKLATAGQDKPGMTSSGGDAGIVSRVDTRAGVGGGGGATSRADGGDGGGEGAGRRDIKPERGSLGSGGGGGEGNASGCDAGGVGGNGFIALRRI